MVDDSSELESFLLKSSEDSKIDRPTFDPNSNDQAKKTHIFALYSCNIILLYVLVWWSVREPKVIAHEFYSPVRHIVRYKDVVFLDNIYEVSPWQGPPDDVKDELWDKLYQNTSTTLVDSKSAKKLPNRTMVMPGTDRDGIISLEVFHQPHCLNALRKSLYLERFPDYSVFFPNSTRNLDISIHHDHCVDRIRQAIICESNLGATYWTWNEQLSKWHINMKTTQTCRNCDEIRTWAVDRNVPD